MEADTHHRVGLSANRLFTKEGANHDEANLSAIPINVELCRRSSPGACIGLVCSRHASRNNDQSNARGSVQSTSSCGRATCQPRDGCCSCRTEGLDRESSNGSSRGERSRESLSYQGEPLLLAAY